MDAVAREGEDIVRWIERGDLRQAGSALVERHAGEVYGLCRSMVRDDATAEDLTQDTFSRAFVGLEGYRGDASPRTWILRIARHRCVDYLRSIGREPWRRSDDDGGEPADTRPLPAELLIRRQDVERSLAELSEGERALIVLRFGHGLGYGELAEAFGIKEGAVRMRVSRALSRMRAALERAEAPAGRAMVATAPAPAAAAPLAARPASSGFRITSRSRRAAGSDPEALANWFKRNLPQIPRKLRSSLRRHAKKL